ncbi:hypothetical protein F6456_28580 [Streptomyces sp. LBUM 1484]|nr:hypothetical protein [Streptomyces sp. LBUM 1484]
MGYLIVLTVAARVRMARRGGARVGDPVDFVFEILFGIIVGAATIVPLAVVPAALGTEHPRFWPLIPVAVGATVTLLVMRRQLRRGQSGADRTEADDTGTEGAPARP